MGNEYTFRVLSENICGMSDDAAMSKNTAVISKTGTGYWKLQKLDYVKKSVGGYGCGPILIQAITFTSE